jgi:hypothetical protein
MQALNHVVFGSFIAVILPDPLIAAPLAFGSHFLMDSIPHYGEDHKAPRGSRRYITRILLDTTASILIVLYFLSLKPAHPGLLMLCAFIAVSPDLLWPLALFIRRRGPLWEFFKFHKLIQKETRKGIFIEAAWFLVTTSLTIYLIRI